MCFVKTFYILVPMTDIQKFQADISKIMKHDRADNGGHYDGKRASKAIAGLFENNNRYLGTLAPSLTDYWLNTYILSSADAVNEPTEQNISRICALQSFIDGDESAVDILTQDDWSNLQELVNCEAEDIPLDDLQNMMGIILNKGAL